ncbi:MAG TPA: CHAT domain-containing protein, partial [Phaeodactylibacter sp.]|nr:CHAT domain-containing protein [Phaeodactylibacter sp.]
MTGFEDSIKSLEKPPYTMRFIHLLVLLLFSCTLWANTDSLDVKMQENNTAFANSLSVPFGGGSEIEIDSSEQVLLRTAQSLTQAKNTKEALEQYQNLLALLLPNLDKEDILANPTDSDLDFPSPLLIYTLSEKAKLLESLADGIDKKNTSLQAALSCRELVVAALFQLRQSYHGKQLSYNNTLSERKEEQAAIRLAYSLYEKTNDPSFLLRCFRLMERSKKTALSYALIHPHDFRLANLPSVELKEMASLKKNVIRAKAKWVNALHHKTAIPEKQLTSLEENYLKGKKHFLKKISSFSKKYPQIYALLYNESIVTVGEIQNRLERPEQVFLSYYNTDDYLYGFVITRSGLKAKRIEKTENLDTQIFQLHQILQSNKEETHDCAEFNNLALQLYQQLLQPFEPLQEELIIVPDGAIGYVPFNALLTEAPTKTCAFSSYSFLLHKYQISMHYSSEEFAKDAFAKNKKTWGRFMAISEDDKSYVHTLVKQLGGNWIKRERSTEDLLVKTMHVHPLLLFANEVVSYNGDERSRSPLLWLADQS